MTGKERSVLANYFDILDSHDIKRIDEKENIAVNFSEEYHRRIEAMCKSKRTKYLSPKKIIIIGAIILSILITICSCTDNPIKDFFVQMFTNGSLLTTDNNEPDFNITYAISRVPAGFELSKKESSDVMTQIEYSSGEKIIRLKYSAFSQGAISYDTENAPKEQTEINGCIVHYAINNGYYIAVWKKKSTAFTLTAPESVGWEALADMIESIEEVLGEAIK